MRGILLVLVKRRHLAVEVEETLKDIQRPRPGVEVGSVEETPINWGNVEFHSWICL